MRRCIRIPVGCIDASGFPDNADQCRFPDKGGGFFRSVVQMESTAVSKTSDFGSSPDRSAHGLLV